MRKYRVDGPFGPATQWGQALVPVRMMGATMKKKKCEICESPIPKERLEILPDTKLCVKCSAKNPEPPSLNADEVCAVPSRGGRNGFGYSD